MFIDTRDISDRRAARMQRRAERKAKRMAGEKIKDNPEVLDAMEDPGPVENGGSGDLSAKSEGYRNKLESRLGTEEYERLGAKGHDDPTEQGQYSAAEVISEFRNAKKNGYSGVDDGDNSVLDYFKQLQADGATFNNKAQEYLGKYGMDFTKAAEPPKTGQQPVVEDEPIEEETDYTPEIEPITTTITLPDEDTISPNPVRPMPTPITPPMGGGIFVGGDVNQNVGKQGDMTTTIGDGNTFTGSPINNDYSVTIGGNQVGNNTGSSFGVALDQEKQRRAAEGAFANGISGGLTFS